MSSQQLLEEIKRLTLDEQIDLMAQIVQLLREAHASGARETQERFDPSAIDRLHGALRGSGPALTDQEAEQIRYEELMEKHK